MLDNCEWAVQGSAGVFCSIRELWIKVCLHHIISYMAHEGWVTRACRDQIWSLFKQTLLYCYVVWDFLCAVLLCWTPELGFSFCLEGVYTFQKSSCNFESVQKPPHHTNSRSAFMHVISVMILYWINRHQNLVKIRYYWLFCMWFSIFLQRTLQIDNRLWIAYIFNRCVYVCLKQFVNVLCLLF